MKLSRITAEEYIKQNKTEDENLFKSINLKKAELLDLQKQYDSLLRQRDEARDFIITQKEELNRKCNLLSIRQTDIEASRVRLNAEFDQIKEMRKEIEKDKQDVVTRAKLCEEKDFYRQQEFDKKLKEIERLKNEYLALHDKNREQIKINTEESQKIAELKEATQAQFNISLGDKEKAEQLRKELEEKKQELWNKTTELGKVERRLVLKEEELNIRDKSLVDKEKGLRTKERELEESALYLQSKWKRVDELIEIHKLKKELDGIS